MKIYISDANFSRNMKFQRNKKKLFCCTYKLDIPHVLDLYGQVNGSNCKYVLITMHTYICIYIYVYGRIACLYNSCRNYRLYECTHYTVVYSLNNSQTLY